MFEDVTFLIHLNMGRQWRAVEEVSDVLLSHQLPLELVHDPDVFVQ